MLSYLLQDYEANRGDFKSILVLMGFRLTSVFSSNKKSILWWVGIPIMITYRLVTEYLLGIELRPCTKVGRGLKIEHGYGLVVNDRAIIGNNVHLRHGITIGCKKMPDGSQGPSPIISDNVEFGSNSIVIGAICIGANSVIGAGSVVVKDVPSDVVVVGNPARVVKVMGQDKSTV